MLASVYLSKYNQLEKLVTLFYKYEDAHTLETSNSKTRDKTALSNETMTGRKIK